MKKVLSLVLVAVLAIGMSVSGFAANKRITGYADDNVDGLGGAIITASGLKLSTLGDDVDEAAVGASLDLGDVFPVDEVELYLDLAGESELVFTGDGTTDDGDVAGADLTTSLLSKVTVHTRYNKGKEVIDEVKLVKNKQRIEIIFNTEFTSVKELDFEFTVYLRFDNKGTSNDGVTFTGTFCNEEVSFDKDTDYIFMSDQIRAKADDSIRNVELDLGQGVKMDANLTKGKTYYGIADQDGTDADMDLIKEYGFKEMYWLKTVNLSTTGNYITFEELDRGDYVYGYESGVFTFLGMGNETFPYYTKYFVSSSELDIAGASETPDYDPDYDYGEPSIEDPTELDPGLGGDDDDYANANYNPSTGA